MKEKIAKYIAVSKKLEELEEEKTLLREDIETMVSDTYDDEDVKIFYKNVPVWEFSEELKREKKILKTKVDTMESEEKVNGVAKQLNSKRIINIVIFKK